MDAVEEGLAWDWMGSRQQGHCVRPRLRWCVVRQARQKVWPACMRAASSPKPSLNLQMGRDAPQHCQYRQHQAVRLPSPALGCGGMQSCRFLNRTRWSCQTLCRAEPLLLSAPAVQLSAQWQDWVPPACGCQCHTAGAASPHPGETGCSAADSADGQQQGRRQHCLSCGVLRNA